MRALSIFRPVPYLCRQLPLQRHVTPRGVPQRATDRRAALTCEARMNSDLLAGVENAHVLVRQQRELRRSADQPPRHAVVLKRRTGLRSAIPKRTAPVKALATSTRDQLRKEFS